MSKVLTGIRPSLWARCPTAAVFQGRGEQEAEHPPEAEEYFFRGNVFEEIVVRQLIAKHGKDEVERQVVIPIPGIGEGHADAYLRSTKTLVEIGSTTSPHPNSQTFEFKVRQSRIYLAYHPEAEEAAVYLIDPNRMKPADVYTVRLSDEDPKRRDRDLIEDERTYIVAAVEGRTELEPHGSDYRPCTRPSQARGRMCPFALACFGEDWVAPPATEITDPHVLGLVAKLAGIKDAEREYTALTKELEEGKRDAQGELEEILPVGESTVGPFTVRRSDVQRSPSFSLKAAQAAGFPVHTLDEFMQPGASYSTFRISAAETEGEINYGTEPF